MITIYPITRYLNSQYANAPTVSADGKWAAFLSDLSGVTHLWRIPLTDPPRLHWPQQLTFGQNRALGGWFSPTDPNLLVYAKDAGGNENAQLFALDVAAGIETGLTTGFDDAIHLPGGWSPDGNVFAYAGNRRHPAYFDLYCQPIDGAAQLIWENNEAGYLTSVVFSANGQEIILQRAKSSFHSELLKINLASGEAQLLTPPNVQAAFSSPQIDDQDSILTVTDYESDFLYIAQLDLTSLRITPYIAAEWDINWVRLSPDKKSLLYQVNAGGIHQLYLRDRETGETILAPMPAKTGIMVGYLQPGFVFAPDSGSVLFSHSSAARPEDIFIWRRPEDTAHPLTQSSSGGIPAESFVAPELIHYPTFDGREIPAWLYMPANAAKKVPVVVLVHGGPEGQSETNFNFLVQYFVNNGFAALLPNVRGSTGYGKAYAHLDDVEKRMDAVEDLGFAARWLKAHPAIDGGKLAVYGGSYGGFMTLSTLTTHPDLWAAGVDIVGISNFVTFLENTSDYRRAHREAEYGSLARDRGVLERISPLNHLDKLKAPLLVIHGANDPRVPASEAEQLVAKLEARQHSVELMIFEDEGHGIAKLKNKQKMYPAIVDFLKRHLG